MWKGSTRTLLLQCVLLASLCSRGMSISTADQYRFFEGERSFSYQKDIFTNLEENEVCLDDYDEEAEWVDQVDENDNHEMSAKEIVDMKIKEGPVVIFSKSYCGYCDGAKRIFKELGTEVIVEELDKREEKQMREMQAYLGTVTGETSVPRVFIGGKFVGGLNGLEEIRDQGELVELIRKAGGTLNDDR